LDQTQYQLSDPKPKKQRGRDHRGRGSRRKKNTIEFQYVKLKLEDYTITQTVHATKPSIKKERGGTIRFGGTSILEQVLEGNLHGLYS